MSDLWNFEHGTTVVMAGGSKARVWMPRWWQLWRHVAWLLFRWQQRTSSITLTSGETMRLVAHDRSKADG